MITLTVHYGDSCSVHHTYKFRTKAESEAFLIGVDEAVGYMDYGIVSHDGCSKCDGEDVDDHGTTKIPEEHVSTN